MPEVASIHSALLQAVAVVAPAGNEVTVSSHDSASWAASSTAPCWAELGDGSGPAAATVCRATSLARSKLTLPSCGANIFCIWPMIWFMSIWPPENAPNICSMGVPLKGFSGSSFSFSAIRQQ